MFKKSEVGKNALEYFKDPIVANVWLDKYALRASEDEYIETTPSDTIVRMAKELYRIEQTYPNPSTYDDIHSLLKDYNKFVLAGSCLFGIGNKYSVSSLGNCFLVDSPLDSIGGIYKIDQELAQIMKRRGGVGVDLSTLRGKGRKINNAAISSTGIASWMEQYSSTTRRIAQEGRRGALMLSLDIEHEDAEYFITAKDDLSKITGANISVRISDNFMMNFDSERNKNLWNKLVHQAWKSAEPGVLFWDRIIANSPADCYSGFETKGTNPCSELPLCPYDSCRLATINLYAYVINPFTEDANFDYLALAKDVRLAQRMMDNIIDLEAEKIELILKKLVNDPEPSDVKQVEIDLWNKIQTKLLLGRRTGLGQMGLADTFAALGIAYGSEDSIALAHEISKIIACNSYISSIIMAEERKPFPMWDSSAEMDNIFIQRIKTNIPEYIDKYNKFGRRNISNLAIAPTGSISMLAGVSSGIEPVYALTYTRRRKVTSDNENKIYQDKQGDWWEEYKVNHPVFQTWKNKYPDSSKSPYDGSTAYEVDIYRKLDLQSKIQPWVDHSISVTYNLPKDVKEEVISTLYYKAWFEGLKGITVYRDGSREGILSTETKFTQHDAPKRPKVLPHDVYNIKSRGQNWTVCVGILDSKPYEVFAFNHINFQNSPTSLAGEIVKQRKGKYDLAIRDIGYFENITEHCSDEENLLTRMISTSLRHGADIKFVVEQLNKSRGDITSFGKGIARVLKKYIKDGTIVESIVCPTCNKPMVAEGGCFVCKECGTSKCD